MRKVELLAPAKDATIGIAAITHGADAVYIGAPAFGARKAAANSIEDIARLVRYAHQYYCRVFVTLNTLLYDHELADAERMIRQLYKIGTDALIIQDMGILRLDIPPVCLHASTQMHNYDLEKIKFLDHMGFQRIVLARELSLEQIRLIRQEVKAELEVFVHGALCISLSGQCYLSQYMSGRSANRGECAQPCRMKWSVKDDAGKILVSDKYILSLKDLNLSSCMKDLIDAGVDSFKIEGRLKDENYVSNVTNYYSSLISQYPDVQRTGSGKVMSDFVAEPERSFNRGYSTYFMVQRQSGMVNPDTPKSMGKRVGRVVQVKGTRIQITPEDEIHNGDGLCYLENGELKGIKVNGVEGEWFCSNDRVSIACGTELYRNYDRLFIAQMEKARTMRKVSVKMEIMAENGHLWIRCTDEDGTQVEITSKEVFDKANHPLQQERLKQQVMKCGDTIYICSQVDYQGDILFVPSAAANALRRQVLQQLDQIREKKRIKMLPGVEEKGTPFPGIPDWHLNVVNHKAVAFYREHGVKEIESGFEKKNTFKMRDLMYTRYCILYELGRCRKHREDNDICFPLYLYNEKHQFRLEFDCKNCFMQVMKKC